MKKMNGLEMHTATQVAVAASKETMDTARHIRLQCAASDPQHTTAAAMRSDRVHTKHTLHLTTHNFARNMFFTSTLGALLLWSELRTCTSP